MDYSEPLVYAVKHKDESIRAESRSGGVFTAISDLILAEGGVIYGCILTNDFCAEHYRAENSEERNKMRGSKYIQSRIGDTFKNVQSDLDAGRKVLFSGTSCQVAGLKKYLGKEYKNLLCVDIVCHGVPSKNVWLAFLRWQEKKNHSRVVNVDFRNKKDFGWHAHVETVTFENGKSVNSKIFKNLFLGNNVLRPSCYECQYKTIMHPGDITIADYWGIENAAVGFDDNRGVSLVLINNRTGYISFEKAMNQLIWKKTNVADSMQEALRKPSPRPKTRDAFWRDFNKCSFTYVAKKYGGYGLIREIKFRLVKIKRTIIK